MKKKSVGRPKSEEPKQKPVTIRMTEDEYNTLKEYSQEHSLTMTQVITEGIKLVYSKS